MRINYGTLSIVIISLFLSIFIAGRGEVEGGEEGGFTLISGETGPGGEPVPLNHTVNVGSSTLYRVMAVNGLNETVDVLFSAEGLVEGASVVITPQVASIGSGESVEVEVLLTLTSTLDYRTTISTFLLSAYSGGEKLSSLPITFVPLFNVNFRVEWESGGLTSEVVGYSHQELYTNIVIENLCPFYDDYLLEVLSHPAWVHATLPGGDASYMVRVPAEKNVTEVPLLLSVEGEGVGEVLLRVSSMASAYNGEALSETLVLTVKTLGELPVEASADPHSLFLSPGERGEVVLYTFNPNTAPLQIYLTEDVLDPEEAVAISVTHDPKGTLTLRPGEGARWNLTVVMGQQLTAGDVVEISVCVRSREGDLLNSLRIPVFVKALPSLTFIAHEDLTTEPDTPLHFNITLLNSGNCHLYGSLHPTSIPDEALLTATEDFLHLSPGEVKKLGLTLLPSTPIPPGNYLLKITFQGVVQDLNLTAFSTSLSINLTVVGEPLLWIEVLNSTGYLVVTEGEVREIEILFENRGVAPSEGGTYVISTVSRGYSMRVISEGPIPSLRPGENHTIRVTFVPTISTVKLRVEAFYGEKKGTTEVPVTVYTPIPPPVGPGSSSGISTGKIVATVALSGLAGALATLLFSRHEGISLLLSKMAIPFYSKLSSDEILENKIRRDIYQYIKTHPGEHFRSILMNLGLKNGTLAYHLYTLEKEELIKSRKDGLYRRFYPVGYKVEPVVPTNGMGKIYRLIVSEPGITQKEVAQRLGLPNSTVNYNIKKLQRQGLIEVRREGRFTRLYPSHTGA